MRRLLILMAAFGVAAGAFAAGAVLFAGDEDEKRAQVEVRCFDDARDCRAIGQAAARAACVNPRPDAVDVSVIFPRPTTPPPTRSPRYSRGVPERTAVARIECPRR
jgi:hypothetical protein